MLDYPNMSHCMCNNTLAAMNQIMDAMEDVDFIETLNPDELRDYNELVHVAKMFAKQAERMLYASIDKNIGKWIDQS